MEIEDVGIESVLHYRTNNNNSSEDDQELDMDVDLADIRTHALHAHGYTKVRTEGSSHGETQSSTEIELSWI